MSNSSFAKPDRVRRLPKGFLAGALLKFSSPVRNGCLCQSRWGINASDGGSGSEPFFNLSVLFETDACFGMMVLVPDRSATRPFKADRVSMLPESVLGRGSFPLRGH